MLLLELYVKDKTTLHNSKFWRVVVMVKQDDQFFGDFKLQSLWKDEDGLLKIEQMVQAMTRYNVWIKTILSKQKDYYFMKDTQIQLQYAEYLQTTVLDKEASVEEMEA